MPYTTLEGRIIENWKSFQQQLGEAMRPLSPEQLRFRPAADQRSLGDLLCHIISVRAGWFCFDLQEGSDEIEALMDWQESGQPERNGDEIADALARSWGHMEAAMARWTPEQWGASVTNDDGEANERAWVVWHLLEHDLHHGGQVFLLCGLQGIPYPAL